MEEKEIEQRMNDARDNIPLKEELEESKKKLEDKLERYEENKPNLYNSAKRRTKAFKLSKAKNIKNKCLTLCRKSIRIGILIVLGVFLYQLIIRFIV